MNSKAQTQTQTDAFAHFKCEIGDRVEVLRDCFSHSDDHAVGGHRLTGPDVRTATVDNCKNAYGRHYLVDVDGAGRFWVSEAAVRPLGDGK